jgi:hypothetical protein
MSTVAARVAAVRMPILSQSGRAYPAEWHLRMLRHASRAECPDAEKERREWFILATGIDLIDRFVA